jgi:hypothetical protein
MTAEGTRTFLRLTPAMKEHQAFRWNKSKKAGARIPLKGKSKHV